MNRGSEAMERGLRHLLLGDARAAVEQLEEACRRLPGEPAVLHALAVAQRLTGQVRAPGALVAAQRAVTLAPRHPVLLSHLALLHWLDGHLAQAWHTLGQALDASPTHRVARYYRGLLHRLDGRLREALDDLEAARAPGPDELPRLLTERIAGQIFDTRRLATERIDPSPGQLACVAAISELLLLDGSTRALGLTDAPETADSVYGINIYTGPAVEITTAEAAQLLHRARRVVALTGAGASADAGLATRKELWKIFDRDRAVSAMMVHQSLVELWKVIETFLGDQTHAPGVTHHVLGRLPRLDAIVTQNVDDLHQRAEPDPTSPRPIVELHGTLERTRCARCGADGRASAGEWLRRGVPLPPTCVSCGRGRLRPDVVLFGEWVPARELAQAVEWVTACDLLLVVGCAMDVAPASELPRLAARAGATILEVNLHASRLSDALGTRLLRGPASATLAATYAILATLEPLPPLPPLPPVARRPLEVTIRLDPLNPSMDEATVVSWLRKPGEHVKKDEYLVEMGLDKVNVELTAPRSGRIVALLAREGDVVNVGGPLLRIEPGEEGEDG